MASTLVLYIALQLCLGSSASDIMQMTGRVTCLSSTHSICVTFSGSSISSRKPTTTNPSCWSLRRSLPSCRLATPGFATKTVVRGRASISMVCVMDSSRLASALMTLTLDCRFEVLKQTNVPPTTRLRHGACKAKTESDGEFKFMTQMPPPASSHTLQCLMCPSVVCVVQIGARRQSGFPTFISCQRQDAHVLPKRRQSHQGDKLCDVSTVPLVARWPVLLAGGSHADGEPHCFGGHGHMLCL